VCPYTHPRRLSGLLFDFAERLVIRRPGSGLIADHFAVSSALSIFRQRSHRKGIRFDLHNRMEVGAREPLAQIARQQRKQESLTVAFIYGSPFIVDIFLLLNSIRKGWGEFPSQGNF